MSIDSPRQPDKYAVFGNPIEHSKSPLIHTLFARQTQQNIEYTRALVEPGGFADAADRFFNNGGKGLNITVPFKLDAFDYADELSERAQSAGAVNTLVLQKDGGKLGDNTDGVGLVSDITENLGWSIKNKRVLIIGAGGAVRGVLLPLLQQQPSQTVIVNRTVEKATELARLFSQRGQHGSIGTLSFSDLSASGLNKLSACGFSDLKNQQFDLVINATSSGLHGELPPLPATLFNRGANAYDMVYGQQPTVFMRWALDNGAAMVSDGLGMLVGQAAESFFLWRAVRPQIQPVLTELRG